MQVSLLVMWTLYTNTLKRYRMSKVINRSNTVYLNTAIGVCSVPGILDIR